MRILLVGPMPPPVGGATVLFRQLLDELSARGDAEVRVVSTSRSTPSWASALVQAVITILRIIANVFWCDVISLHSSARGALVFGPLVFLISRVFCKPLIFRSFGDCSIWLQAASPKAQSVFERTLLRSEAVLVETQAAVRQFQTVCDRVYWYPNSRPCNEQVRGLRSGAARKFVFIGHVKPCKGVREIIAAAEMLDDSINVDVYGPLCEGMTEAEFTSKRARYCGAIAPERVRQLLSHYDVLLMPTWYAGEGYPGVILEAYASGLPVIATRWLSMPEIVSPTSGMLIAPGNPHALMEAMCTLSESEPLMRRLRAGACEAALKFSSQQWTRRFVEIAQQVCQRQPISNPATESAHVTARD